MKRLYVLYDAECALCCRCRVWLAQQSAFIELRFIPLQSPEVAARFPGIEKLNLREELVVISDTGGLYRGPSAWIMCLYALREYREWSQRLAQPVILPFTRRICELISSNRLSLSRLFWHSPPRLAAQLQQLPEPKCDTANRCRTR